MMADLGDPRSDPAGRDRPSRVVNGVAEVQHDLLAEPRRLVEVGDRIHGRAERLHQQLAARRAERGDVLARDFPGRERLARRRRGDGGGLIDRSTVRPTTSIAAAMTGRRCRIIASMVAAEHLVRHRPSVPRGSTPTAHRSSPGSRSPSISSVACSSSSNSMTGSPGRPRRRALSAAAARPNGPDVGGPDDDRLGEPRPESRRKTRTVTTAVRP